MRRLTRRRLLLSAAGTLAAGMGIGGLAYWRYRRPFRLAIIGTGGIGLHIASYAQEYARIIEVCDVDRIHAEKAHAELEDRPSIAEDFRRTVAREDVDAVVVATPDHWHTQISIAALDAGKHVYCEKPMTLTISEGFRLIEAVERSGLSFQVGTQQRSDPVYRHLCDMIRAGRLGELEWVEVDLPKPGFGLGTSGPFPSLPAPSHLNWNRWLGQAPSVPYCKERCHGNFRWWYEYSGGRLTDWGAHHLDIVQLALDSPELMPCAVGGKGKFPGVENGYNTPYAFELVYTYPNGLEVHVRTAEEERIHFHGSRGSVEITRKTVKGELAADLDKVTPKKGEVIIRTSACKRVHMQNFLACIETGNMPTSNVRSQHLSSTLCHIGNIALRLGREVRWAEKLSQFVEDEEANKLLSRPRRPDSEIFT